MTDWTDKWDKQEKKNRGHEKRGGVPMFNWKFMILSGIIFFCVMMFVGTMIDLASNEPPPPIDCHNAPVVTDGATCPEESRPRVNING